MYPVGTGKSQSEGQQGRLPGIYADASLAHAGCLLNRRCHAWEALPTSEALPPTIPAALESDSAPYHHALAVIRNNLTPLAHRRLQTHCHCAPGSRGACQEEKCGAKRNQNFLIPSGFPHLFFRGGLVFSWMLQLCLTFKLSSALEGNLYHFAR